MRKFFHLNIFLILWIINKIEFGNVQFSRIRHPLDPLIIINVYAVYFCSPKFSSYDDFQVPDTMNVHGIYETSSVMQVFSSRREYQSHLQTEAGVSGSVFGFYGGAKSAYGTSSSSSQQTNLAVFDIDVDR